MKKHPNAIDGFVPRSSGRMLGQTKETTLGRAANSRAFGQPQTAPRREVAQQPIQQASGVSVSRREIDESLRGIDDESSEQKARRKGIFRRKQAEAPVKRKRKFGKRIAILLLLIVLGFGIYFGVKAAIASMSVLNGNIFGLLQNKPLQQDANGRTNIVVFGTSGSVDDTRHEGANLTDTLMVLSIDQNKKNAYMVSLPRDLYVKYGQPCAEGNSGKINSMYDCYSNSGEDAVAGAKALQTKVAEVTGLTPQYYAHINWAVVVGAVDAVGGIDVDVEGNGYSGLCARYGIKQGGVVDVNMKIKYDKGVHHMTGADALSFSRARGSAGECGLAAGDFDRQLNQQKVLKALQQKALSSETLTNLSKVTSLIDAMGANLVTSFDTSEVRTLASLAKDIPSDKIQSIDLKNEEDVQIVPGNIPGAGSTQVPVDGTYDYSGIHSYINKIINANEITKEGAHVALFNASGIAGLASKRQEALEARGFTITATDNAPEGTYDGVEVYDLTGEKPATKQKLASLYGVTVKTTDAPITVSIDTDFIIIYSKDPTAN